MSNKMPHGRPNRIWNVRIHAGLYVNWWGDSKKVIVLLIHSNLFTSGFLVKNKRSTHCNP